MDSQRRQGGRYQLVGKGEASYRAFMPAPLSPPPTLNLSDGTLQKLQAAALALGRLDAISELLPEKSIFLYHYVRKEAVLSSRIEGTQSSLSDLLLHEQDEKPGVPVDDVREVSRCVAAVTHSMERLRRDGLPLSNRLLCEAHAVLMHGNLTKTPGEFRRSQNWTGGTSPANAAFVPPPASAVVACMADLERFLHADDGLLMLVRAGVAHVQFETIHPFVDGNGRIGRMLITLLLCAVGFLREPLLYLSLYFKTHRSTYYDLLNRVRSDGAWEEWLAFFLTGIRETAEGAVSTARQLSDLFARDREHIVQAAGRRANSALRIHGALMQMPVLSITEAARRAQVSYPTAQICLAWLAEQGLAQPFTQRVRNRLFVYDKYLAVLNDETQ